MVIANIETVQSIHDIPSSDWDQMANPANLPFDPFISHAFLGALEKSGSVSAEAGWLPFHLKATDENGALIGVVPNYLKSHSQGEYVFDHSWADAFYRAGIEYYPKMQVSVPFSPVTGRRLLCGNAANTPDAQLTLLTGLERVLDKLQLSSAHITFCEEAETQLSNKTQWLIREGQQFHFENAGFETFNDFLDTLASRKRKAIKKERKQALEDGITIVHKTGDEITEADWDVFFAFYMDTGARKWGTPYLNREFFSLLGEWLGSHVLLIFALRNGKPFAGALNMIGGDTLFGRYWGCSDYQPALHFELCYYQAMDYAIAHKIARVEAGAQGGHKLARGYVPQTTYSMHRIPDPRFHVAIERFLTEESDYMACEADYLKERTPFKRDNDGNLILPGRIKKEDNA